MIKLIEIKRTLMNDMRRINTGFLKSIQQYIQSSESILPFELVTPLLEICSERIICNGVRNLCPEHSCVYNDENCK